MRLVQEGDNWRIAWSTMDILDGYANDVNLQVDSRFPQRASIYDRDGQILAENNGTIMVIGVIQQDMPNVDDCITILAETMMRSRLGLVRLFAGYNAETYFQIGEMDSEIYFSRRDEIDFACGLDVPADPFVKVSQYTNRRYYGGAAMAHAVGYIGRVPGDQLGFWQARGYGAGDIVGRAGIEYAFDAQLAGTPERILRLLEPGGATIRELGGATGSEPTPIQLTLDRDLQYQTAKALNDAFNYAAPNWAQFSNGGAAVVMDVNTGEILAIASYPTFDPNIFNPDNAYPNPAELLQSVSNDIRSPLSNKAVQEQYTPGSIYKIITTATAATEGVWSSDTIFNCELTWEGKTALAMLCHSVKIGVLLMVWMPQAKSP
jgi:cell division protein FtsI/penicillin-binding protein 2